MNVWRPLVLAVMLLAGGMVLSKSTPSYGQSSTPLSSESPTVQNPIFLPLVAANNRLGEAEQPTTPIPQGPVVQGPTDKSPHNVVLDDADLAKLAQEYPAFRVDESQLRAAATPGELSTLGQWGSVIQWPHVPVTAANLPDGRILTWASNQKDAFPNGQVEFTYTAVWDPASGTFEEIDYDTHDLFCSQVTVLEDGRVFANGGRNKKKTPFTSVFDSKTNTWSRIETMNDGRWYPTTVGMGDGSVFTAIGTGASQYPELWRPSVGWEKLNGIDLSGPILDQVPYWNAFTFPFLTLAPNGKIFHSGPTPHMHYLDPANGGSITPVGLSNTDWYPKDGTYITYDEGKILLVGGVDRAEPAGRRSTNKALTIDLNGATPQMAMTSPMHHTRSLHNLIVLPNGEVLVVGGNMDDVRMSDEETVLTPEIWNPDTGQWREVADMSVPRNYHSVALLMPDGRVWAAGGGLCGNCATNHADAQIYTPPYLFAADGSLAQRPVIQNAPAIVQSGTTVNVQATPNVARFTMVKIGATTHQINTDQRYLSVPFSETSSGQYELTLHSNVNVLTPGYWMLFALDAASVPSIAHMFQVDPSGNIHLVNPGKQESLPGDTVTLQLDTFDPAEQTLSFSQQGLPPGLSIGSATGMISGTLPTNSTGTYSVTVTATDGQRIQHATFDWQVILTNSALVGYWAFDDGSGTTAIDSSTSGNDGLLMNGPTWTTGRIGGALEFDGVDDYVIVNGLSTMALGDANADFSVTYWLNLQETATNDWRTILHKATVNNDRTFSMWMRPSSDRVSFRISTDFKHSEGTNSDVLIAPNQWTHIAYVKYDDTLSLYVNGQLDAQADLQGSTIANSGPLYIGKDPWNNGLKAILDEIQIYERALSALEIEQMSGTGPLTLLPIQPEIGVAGERISFHVSAAGGDAPTFKWLFGDGTPETAYTTDRVVHHVFADPGRYLVKLTGKDQGGQEISTEFTQIVVGQRTTQPARASSTIVYEVRKNKDDRIWNVNPDNDSVTIYNADNRQKLLEVPVGDNPRSVAVDPDGNAWVTNKGSATVSIIDGETLAVTQTLQLPHNSLPHGIVFSPPELETAEQRPSIGYVAMEATGDVFAFDAGTHQQIGQVNVGPGIRQLSVSYDNSLLLVSRFITPRLPGEETANVQSELNGQPVGGEVVAIDPATMSVVKTIILHHSSGPDTEFGARGFPNYLGAAVISPDGKEAWIPSKQDNVERGGLRDGLDLTHDSSVRAITSRVNLTTLEEVANSRIDIDNAGVASALVFNKDGTHLFVALESNREVAVIDPFSGTELFRFMVGRAPQGLALTGNQLFVHNFTDRTVIEYNIKNVLEKGGTTVTERARYTTVNTDQLSANVLLGKQLFYDAADDKLALESYISCASCHNEGGQDGRVWDFTGFGEGLRNTIALQGHGGMAHGPLHWSGNFDEVQDFEGQIRGFAAGSGLMADVDFHAGTRSQPLGDPKAGISPELDALAAYVSSLTQVNSSPYRQADGSLTVDGQRGRVVFQSVGCLDCHGGTDFTDSTLGLFHDVGTLKASSGQRLNGPLVGLDTPTLRGIWQTFPYLHDGSAATLAEAVTAHSDVDLNTADLDSLVAYLRQIDESEAVPPELPPFTPTPTATQTPLPTATGTATPTSVPSNTSTATPTATQPPAATPSPTATTIATETPTPTPTSTSAVTCGSLLQEAEAGALFGNFQIDADPSASGGAYIQVPNGTGNSGPNGHSYAQYCFTVLLPNIYHIKGWVHAASGTDDSFFVEVDEVPVNGYLWDTPLNTTYEGHYVTERDATEPVQIALSAGEHIVTFLQRDDGTRLDKVELVLVDNSTTPTPTAIPTNTPQPTATPTATPAVTCGGLIQEAEAGALFGNFQVYADPLASGGAYIQVPNGTGNSGPNGRSYAQYCFTVTTAGTYQIKGWVHAASGADDSFFVEVDEVPVNGYLWDTPLNTTYEGHYVTERDATAPVQVVLSAGEHTVTFLQRDDGTRLDKVEIVSTDTLPTPTPTATPTNTPQPTATPTATPAVTCGGLIQEAEAGALFGNFQVYADPLASGGAYIQVPNGTGNSGPNGRSYAQYCFTVTTAGTYQIKGWVHAASGADDSFFVEVDEVPVNGYLWDTPLNTTYEGHYVTERDATAPVQVILSAGEHTVTFLQRDDGTRLDKVELVQN